MLSAIGEAPTCEALLTLDHRAPERAAGPTGRTKARAVEESISRTVAVGAPMIMVGVALRVLRRWLLGMEEKKNRQGGHGRW